MDRTALARATEASDSPTPGYLYVDIAKSAASSPVACAETATYLTNRLSSKSNHNVKYKCLKVIAKVAESPATRGQFKRAVCQDAAAVAKIKEALNFRGPPDPARGDEIYRRVHDAAREALDAIYSDAPSSTGIGGGGGGMMGGSMGSGAGVYGGSGGGGVGSSSYGAPVAQQGGGGGGRRMEGIGNPVYGDPRDEKDIGQMTIGEIAGEVGRTVVNMVKDPLAKNVQVGPPVHSSGRSSSMPGYGSGGAYGIDPPGRSQLAHATGNQWTMASNRGPNAIGAPQNYNSERDEAYFKARDGGSNAFQWAGSEGGAGGARSAGGPPSHSGVGGSWATAAPSGAPPPPPGQPSIASQARAPPHQSFSAPSGTVGSATGGAAASDGSYERNLILELCPPGGMRAEPPPDKLASFVKAFPSLDPDLVCPALLDCLEDGQPWIMKAKALCVMDAILKASEEATDGGSNAYGSFFHACAAEIEPLASHARPAIRDPAKRVLKALGLDVASPLSEGGVAASPAKAPAPVEPPNLLDFGDDDDTPAAPAESPSAPSPSAVSPAEPSAATATANSGGGSLFGGLTVQDKAPDTAALGSGGAPPPPVASPPAAAPAAEDDTLLGETPAPAPGATGAAAEASGLFGDMAVKGSSRASGSAEAAPTEDVSQTIQASGSAFGFMNNGTGGGESKPIESPVAAKTSFDPLLNANSSAPSHQQQSMQMNPQMQAMAYQQNMMMMQAQMQQMQMAMAMQQQQMAGGAQPGRQPGPRGGSFRASMPVRGVGGPMNPNVMRAHSMKQIPVMGGKSGDPASSFSFLGGPEKKEEEKSFNFVQDAMKDASKK